MVYYAGIVYCGTVGNETRREYAVVGDVVNLSARLMSKANGEILLDEKTYSRLPEIIHKKLKKQPLMVVKGKEKAIVTYLFDTTHSVQADGRLGAALVDLSIDVELPIRLICKDALLGPLGHLSPASAVRDIQVRLFYIFIPYLTPFFRIHFLFYFCS
jgi:Adenylate and Guanylate cyclase catalytic domain